MYAIRLPWPVVEVKFGWRPIHFALYRTLDHVKYLEDHGADLQAEGGLQRNALHFAVVSGRLDLVRYVMQKFKGFINELDCDGWTPLFCALREAQIWDIRFSQRTDIIEELKENGAEIMICADGGLEGDAPTGHPNR
ncbi:hypothetical protein ABOM_011268 [Aspergillus bombycis]|uniref:Uncharacterized protein n=1 Tax=Aspergillus bombycis TaxID=109264 RepID=A0A1F7ZKU8_9EURO|nr:hypothetical protein ABOM_011268 [Aspergillus bombycis]OGM40073.1 hypothetical protein ABOM_011268 [Aspergillus bombycis]